MSTKKWSEIKKLSRATEPDRAEAKAELEVELRCAGGPWAFQDVLDRQDELADMFEASYLSTGHKLPVEELLEPPRGTEGTS